MEKLDLYQKILKELTEANPDLVEEIKKSRKSNNEYPKNIFSKVSEYLSNNSELKNQFIKEDSLNKDKKLFYDLIFHIEEKKDNADTNESEFHDNEEYSNEKIEYTPSMEDSDYQIYFKNYYGDESSSDIPFEYSTESNVATPEVVEQTEEEDEEKVKPPQNNMTFDVKSFKARQTSKIQRISQILSLPEDSSYFLLKKFNWNTDMLLEKWKLIQPEISEWIIRKNNFINVNIGKGICPICCDDECDLYQLYCGHSLCLNCIKNEILIQLEKNEFPVMCRCDDCKSEILVHEIQRFCGDEIAQEYSDRYIEHQMFLDDQLVKCTSPDCENFLNRTESKYCNIGICQCGKHVCLECHNDSHAPLRCDQVEKWNQICTDMIQLSVDQQNWLTREDRLAEYRKEHLDEVQNAFDEYKNQFLQEHEEQDQRKIDEINELKEKIQNEKTEELILNLKQKIIDMELALEFNQKQRQRDIENFGYDIEDFINSVKKRRVVVVMDAVGYNTKEQKFEKLTIKKCPKCDAFIYKDGGCNHMTCKMCKHQFCWVCFRDWEGHGGGYNRCQYVKDDSNNNSNLVALAEAPAGNNNNNDGDDDGRNRFNNARTNDNSAIRSLIEAAFDNYDDFDEIAEDSRPNRAAQIRNRFRARGTDDNDDNNNNEGNQANQPEPSDQQEPPDHEFVLPPMNAELRPQYNRWRKIVNTCRRYTDGHAFVLKRHENLSPFFQNAIKNTFSVLMNAYKLLFMLEPGSFKFRKLEFLINDLEHYYKGMANGAPLTVEFIDACKNSIENLLINANLFNF